MRVRRSNITIAAVLLIEASGCFRPVVPGSERSYPGRDVLPRRPGSDTTTFVRDRSEMATLTSKRVESKEAPSTLVARDGSRCTVTAKRFAGAREGEDVWCAWTGDR